MRRGEAVQAPGNGQHHEKKQRVLDRGKKHECNKPLLGAWYFLYERLLAAGFRNVCGEGRITQSLPRSCNPQFDWREKKSRAYLLRNGHWRGSRVCPLKQKRRHAPVRATVYSPARPWRPSLAGPPHGSACSRSSAR